MKKSGCPGKIMPGHVIIKYLLLMKFVFIILLATSFQAIAINGVSQDRINMDVKNISISAVLNRIQSKYEYRFFYTDELGLSNRKVDFLAKNATIDDVMDKLLNQTGYSYKKINSGLIVIIGQPDESLNHEMNGKVIDQNGSPLASVSIIEKGTANGTSSNTDGSFKLSVKDENAILIFSHVGYKDLELSASNVKNGVVTMEAIENKMEEVVVVGYGTQKRTTLTGSIVSVQAKDIENVSVSDPYQSLQGKLPGLRITQQSGQPGVEGISLSIRGLNSFSSNNSPLVLINGTVGDLATLDPSFIESVTVLKDAASASIYGARAANGVILVTTKTGANKSGINVEYNAGYVTQTRINWPKRAWNSVQYMTMMNTAVNNGGGGANLYPDDSIALYKSPSPQYPSFNWEDYIIKPINIFNNSLSIGGRTGNTNYNAAVGIWSQDGIVRGFNYNKYTGMFNMESQLSKRLKLGVNLNSIVDGQKEPYDGVSDAILATINQRPYYGPYTLDGTGHYAGINGWWGGQKSPIVIANEGGQWTNDFGLNGTAYLRFNILKNLTWEVKGGMNHNESDIKWQGPVVPMYDYKTNQFSSYMDSRGNIELRETNLKNNYYTAYSTLNYSETFLHNYHLNALIGVSQEKSDITSLQGYRYGFASSNLDVISAGPTTGQTTAGTETEYALRSFFGRANINYNNKYLFEAAFRRDGSSRFPPSQKYAFFPSFSAGWLISRESFVVDKLPWLSQLKLRASYGNLGNDNVNGNYPYQSVLATGASYVFSNLVDGVVRNNMANNQLKWESTTIKDIGLDFSINNSLLYGSFDYYEKTTSGILRQQQIPGYAGLAGPYVNEGSVQNKGYEFIIGHRSNVGGLKYGVEFNIATNRNKVVKFGAPVYGTTTMMKEGYEMNRYYLYKSDGIYQSQAEVDKGPVSPWIESPGDIRIKDVTGDKKITPDDRVDVGGAYPAYYYGLNLNASWKGFDMTLFFQGEQGRKILIDNRVFPSTNNGVPLLWWEDSWTAANQSTSKPKMIYDSGPLGGSTKVSSTFWLRDASYIRMKNFTFGYTLPTALTKRYSIQRLRIFVNAVNPFTFSKFEFGDPEGTGLLSYPMLRSVTFGLNLQF